MDVHNNGFAPRFKKGDICRFYNRLTTAFRGNDGRLCRITKIKPQEYWHDPQIPEYFMVFLDGGIGFGALEIELETESKEVLK